MDQNQPPILPFVTPRNWDRCDLAGLVMPLKGRRLILVNAEGNHHDFRAHSDLVTDRGIRVVWVVSEEVWWRERLLAMRAVPLRWPAAACWVEVDPPQAG